MFKQQIESTKLQSGLRFFRRFIGTVSRRAADQYLHFFHEYTGPEVPGSSLKLGFKYILR